MSKSQSSLSKFNTFLETLKKLTAYEEKNVDQIRSIISKIRQTLATVEKSKKTLLEETDYIPVMMITLQTIPDMQVYLNIVSLIDETLSSSKRTVSTLLACYPMITQVIMDTLVNVSKVNYSIDDIIVALSVLLCKLGVADKKFGVKARLSGLLEVTISLLKHNTTNYKVLQSMMQLMKLLAGNSVNLVGLGKAGAVSTMLRIITNCGNRHTLVLRSSLAVLSRLVKNKNNAVAAVNQGGMSLMIDLAVNWHKTDVRNKQIFLRKTIFTTLKSLTLTKIGKQKFEECNGVRVLYDLCKDCLETKALDGLVDIGTQILRRCYPLIHLPVANLSGSFHFNLSTSNPDLVKMSSNSNSAQSLSSMSNQGLSGGNYTPSDSDAEYEDIDETVVPCSSFENYGPDGSLTEERRMPIINRSEEDLRESYRIFLPEVDFMQLDEKHEHYSSDSASLVTDPVYNTADMNNASCFNKENTKDYSSFIKFDEQQNFHSKKPGSESDCFISRGYLANVSNISLRTKSIKTFSELPMPEMYGHIPPEELEPLLERHVAIQRRKCLQDIERVIFPEKVINQVVYDLDVESSDRDTKKASEELMKECKLIQSQSDTYPLIFDSRFECGNLRKAIRIRQYEYDLILSPDINTKQYHQWFYFKIRNMVQGVRYQFNIINCIKANSQFNYGMKPLLYSTNDAINNGIGWVRTGYDVCYYKNHFPRTVAAGGGGMKSYFTATFTIVFPHNDDTCFLAYHYPYSYSTMKAHLRHIQEIAIKNSVYFKCHQLCVTLGGNSCDLVTITSARKTIQEKNDKYTSIENRPYIIVSSRVHPGESNASWIMKGLLDFIVSDDGSAIELRNNYIFKIVPMLNPDGVINGCHRCSLSGHDLNRCWITPNPQLHPTIFHMKGLLQYMVTIGKSPLVFCDIHGHSRKKNVFIYGCCPYSSTNAKAEYHTLRVLPKILQDIAPIFSYESCNFAVEKSKESTARIALWRELLILRSYTMEGTYCGMDQGLFKDFHIGTGELENMGKNFCKALLLMKDLSLDDVSSNNKPNAQVLPSKGSGPQDESKLKRTSSPVTFELLIPNEAQLISNDSDAVDNNSSEESDEFAYDC